VRARTDTRTACAYKGLPAAVLVAGRHLSEFPMLETIAVILLVLWLLGLVTSTTLGGFIHVLLVIALVMIVIRFIGGRSA
jgi:hypothetical protein